MAKHVSRASVSIYFTLSNYIVLSGYKRDIREEERSFYERDRKATEI